MLVMLICKQSLVGGLEQILFFHMLGIVICKQSNFWEVLSLGDLEIRPNIAMVFHGHWCGSLPRGQGNFQKLLPLFQGGEKGLLLGLVAGGEW